MSLELFVNFERESNNSLFYRPVSAAPFAATIRLLGNNSDDVTLSRHFIAKYSIGDFRSPGTLQDFDLDYGTTVSLPRNFARTYSIQVHLSAIDDPDYTKTYSLSAKFLDKIPVVTFTAYPSSYFDENTGEQKFCNKYNYRNSNGPEFYGEGHTETIILSTQSYKDSTINWYIGNSTTQSEWIVADPSKPITTVTLTSSPSEDKKIPINVRLTNKDITSSGPIVCYDDVTGEKTYYSFFSSSLDVSGNETSDDPFKRSIHIKPYPKIKNFTFVPGFSSNSTQLPFDYTSKWFTSKLLPKHNNSLLYYTLTSTIWQTDTESADFSTGGNWVYVTRELPFVSQYRFPLKYTQMVSETVPFLEVATTNNTTVTTTVSVIKEVELRKPPYDWIPNTQIEVHSFSTNIPFQPYIKIYAPNYLNIKNEACYFEPIVPIANSFLTLQRVTVSSPNSNSVTLSGSDIAEPFSLVFTKIGKQTLSAVSLFFNENTNEFSEVTNIIPDAVDILEKYDDEINTDYYHYSNSRLETIQLSAPRLSPNEWVTEDNINSVFTKIFNAVEQIIDHTSTYVDDSKFYSWLGPTNYRWTDLECSASNTNKLKWNEQVPTEANVSDSSGFPLFWTQQTCNTELEGDKLCIQKYCLEWNWRSCKRSNSLSTSYATWKNTRQNAGLAKKWSYEPCELDSQALFCELGRWHVSTLDPEFFPLPFCGYDPGCFNVGCAEVENYLVIGKKTELVLIKNSYDTQKLQRAGLADALYAFANIEGLCSEGNKIYVLDSLIPRVSVYEVKDGKLIQNDSWGKYGLATNVYGFNRPKDITIDQNKSLYVADTGNKCIKKYSLSGKYIKTYKHSSFDLDAPRSVCVDSLQRLHVLLSNKIVVLDNDGNYVDNYELPSSVINPTKVTCSYNREIIYVSHQKGIEKYFRTGTRFGPLVYDLKCSNGLELEYFNNVHITPNRNVYVCVNDKILKLTDRMKLISTKAPISSDLYWSFDSIKINKEEYIQPWVYLRAFHRLWDNIELLRNSLFYNEKNSKTYVAPVYSKEQLLIGQNEIVTNAVVNRLCEQLWANIQTLLIFFK